MESEAKAMRKIKWGVMGTAFICERSTFPGMLQAENCEMYAIAGRNMEKAERFKETYGFQKAYGSYEKLLADPKVEAVYIPLPIPCTMNGRFGLLKAANMCSVKSRLHRQKHRQKKCLKLQKKIMYT